MLVLEGLVGLHRTVQLQLLQHYWLGPGLGLLWYWMACLGNEHSRCHSRYDSWSQMSRGKKFIFSLQAPFPLITETSFWSVWGFLNSFLLLATEFLGLNLAYLINIWRLTICKTLKNIKKGLFSFTKKYEVLYFAPFKNFTLNPWRIYLNSWRYPTFSCIKCRMALLHGVTF